jgi:hypothetical protein
MAIIRSFRRGAGLVQLFAVEDEPPTLSLEHDHFALGGVVQDTEPVLRASEAVIFFMCTTYNDAGLGVKTAQLTAECGLRVLWPAAPNCRRSR